MWSPRTQSWRYIDDNTILVKTNDEDSYLITFNAACRGLSEAQSIVAQRSGSSLKSHDRFQIRTYSTLTTSGSRRWDGCPTSSRPTSTRRLHSIG